MVLDDLMTLPEEFMDDYREFESAHRGGPELIQEQRRIYLPILDAIDKATPGGRRALDIGCGRGEWLGLIAEHGWDAVGVDADVSAVAFAATSGVHAVALDALDFLRGCEDRSFGLVTAFHVVEHLDTEVLARLLIEIERVLMPGGVVILETPNPENVTISSWLFRMDAARGAPLPAALLQFLVRRAGMRDLAVLSAGIQERKGLLATSALLASAPDYSVIASPKGNDAIVGAIESFAARMGESAPAFPDLIAEIEAAGSAAGRNEDFARDFGRLSRANAHLRSGLTRLAESQARLEDELLALRKQVRELERMPQARFSRMFRRLKRELRTLSDPKSALRQKLKRLDPLASRPFRKLKARLRRVPLAADSGPPSDLILPSERTAGGKLVGYGEHLALQRLSHAVDLAKAPERSGPGTGKPRLAFVSPLPPAKSGIADYSAQILPALHQHYEIDIISAREAVSDEWVVEHCEIRTADWFRDNAHHYDRILYHVGNSEFHQHMFPLLQKIPGVVVLHDFYLGNIMAHLELYSGWKNYWTSALLHSHGYAALEGRFFRETRHMIYHYPASFAVLEQAQGIIVHSHHARELSQEFYPGYDADAWRIIPLARRLLSSETKAAARQALGFSDEDTIVCSFGFIQDTKLSHRLLDAWLESDLVRDRNCHLVFVGGLPSDAYGERMRSRAGGPENGGRVHIAGFVSAEDYGRYLQAADIGVQLRAFSRGETSAAVLDCLMHGLATVVNANGSMTELPADCVIRLDDQFETSALVAALERLRDDGEERRRLGETARAYMAEHHDPAAIADQYRDAIEAFAGGAPKLHNLPALVDHARELMATGATDLDTLLRHANQISQEGGECRPAASLFVDVSALVREDLRTGIQRVVRALLLQLLHAPPPGYLVEPVWLDDSQGRWQYRHARAYAMDVLGLDSKPFADTPIEAREGDIFLGADFFPAGVVHANVAGLYEEWRARGVQLSFVVYDILPVLLPSCFPPGAEPIHRDWLRVVAEVADSLVCISTSVAETTRDWLRENLGDGHALPVIHGWALGADIDASSPTKGTPKGGDGILGQLWAHDSFLMVGTIEPRKGHLQVIAAFETLWAAGHGARLIIVGNEGWKGVPRDQARNLPEIIDRLANHPELGKRLIWVQGASDEFLESIYREADCLIAASLDEGFGLPLIEAARHDLPILARDVPVFREVAGDAAAYFSAADGLGLAAAIEEWLTAFHEDRHTKSTSMKWLTWAESAERLKQIIIRDDQ